MKLGRAFLVLFAGLSSALIVVAVASGSQAQVTQKALQAPRPSGVSKKKGGIVERVACASAKNCAAIGAWLYSDLGGKWRAAKVPALAGAGGAILRSVDCPAAGSCEAVGSAGVQHAVHVSENGRQWKIGNVDPPPDAAPIAPPSGPAPYLESVDCASARNCVAVGGYLAANRTERPFFAPESNGAWGSGVELQLPPNADTSPDPGQVDTGGALSFVSCPAAGECTAVGFYTNADAGHSYYPWVVTESNGTWSSGQDALLPADAAVFGDLERGPSPFFGFDGLSCPSAASCTAVGGFEDKNGGDEGLILTETDGVWSPGLEAPLPPKAVPNSQPNEFNTPLSSVSCAAPGDCAAVGWYVTASFGTKHGLLLTERNGEWKASTLVLPAKAKAPGGVYLTSVSCPSSGDCLAVGYYLDKGRTHGLLVRERGGKWGRAANAAVPRGAAPAITSHTFLNSVSCASASSCTVGGDYKSRTGTPQGLILNVRLR